ncbi:MAG: site-2 protease family protein, partial [Bacteroidota bacterium]
MFAQSIRLGRILGIPIGMNYTWFIVFVLIALSLTTQFADLHPSWSYAEHLILGIVTSILFFGSIVLHELGHSMLALRYGIPVQAITLFVFGGVAQITREPEKPSQEFFIAVAGPVVSALLGAVFYALKVGTEGFYEGLPSLAEWLARINIAVALFNLIPGFPLDGGRILRSIAWRMSGSFERATVVAAGSGQFFAYVFIFFGVWHALTGNFFNGLWIGFIGWFLLNAAQMSTVQTRLRHALAGVLARDVMAQECLRLPGNLSVKELVEHHLLRTGARCSMIVDGDRFRGLVTLHEIKTIPIDEWAQTSLQAVMIPRESLL